MQRITDAEVIQRANATIIQNGGMYRIRHISDINLQHRAVLRRKIAVERIEKEISEL